LKQDVLVSEIDIGDDAGLLGSVLLAVVQLIYDLRGQGLLLVGRLALCEGRGIRHQELAQILDLGLALDVV